MAAAEMNYRPNYNAQRLAGRASKVIGILIEKNAAGPLFQMLGEIEREAAEYGYRCMIGEFKKEVRLQREQYDIFMQHGVDGVICMPSHYLEDSPEFQQAFAGPVRRIFMWTGKRRYGTLSGICMNGEPDGSLSFAAMCRTVLP